MKEGYIKVNDKNYTEKEIELANQIYYATQAIYHQTTIRKLQNIEKKFGQSHLSNPLPPEAYLEIARNLLTVFHEDFEKQAKDAVDNM